METAATCSDGLNLSKLDLRPNCRDFGVVPANDGLLDTLLSREWGATGGALWRGKLGVTPTPGVFRTAGERIGHYRIEEEIGRGGSSVVYRAHRCDGSYDQKVALKVIHPVPELRERARLERNILGRLSHRAIIQIMDGGETDAGEIWLATELVAGTHIDEFCAERQLTWQERIRLMLEVCDAVAHAHAVDVVHRDIKPDNIIVSEIGHVKLVDFGISTISSADLPHEREVALTLGFASPEQLTGQPVTSASDIYQIGRVVEEVLSFVDLPRHAARNLAAICAKATKQSPAKRYQSVLDLRDDLLRVLDVRPSRAFPWSLGRRMQFFALKTWRSIAAFGTCALFGAACACVLAYWSSSGA